MTDFISKVIEIIAWPMAIVIIVFILRHKIKSFNFKGKGVEVNFTAEQMPPSEVKERLSDEANIIESSPAEASLPKELSYEDKLIKEWKSFATNKPEAYFKIEQYALSFLENKFNEPIQRNIRFNKGNRTVECDGFIKGENLDTIIEIKLLRVANFKWIEQNLEKIHNQFLVYNSITGRPAKFWLVLVSECNSTMQQKTREYFQEICKNKKLDVNIMVIRTEELGLQIIYKKPDYLP